MSDFHYDVTRTDHYSLVNAILYGESVQDGTPTPDAPVDVQVVRTPNLIPFSINAIKTYNTSGTWSGNTYTYRGISVTLNDNGTITVDGTATGNFTLYLVANSNQLLLPDGSYTLTGELPGTGSDSTWYFQATTTIDSSGTVKARNRDYGSGVTFAVDSTVYGVSVYLHTASGDTFNNAVLKPQLIAGSQIKPFVPYGSIGIVVGDTATSIDLQGNVLASLPDGTKDVLTVDGTGHCVLTKTVSHIASYNGESVGNVYLSTTGQLTTGAEIYYKASSISTIDLGHLDVSHLQDIQAEIPVSFVTSLTPDSSYLYKNTATYKVENPYKDSNAPEYAYPPNHFGQEWETFDANDWNGHEMLDYTGQMESHAVYTVELCELMQSGTFDWKRPELDWSEAAYNTEQYERFCKYFEQRFMFREISMLPPLQWFTALKRMLVYELMPKYKPLYAQVENGISPLGENEYYKERHVSSSYPETLLSGNSDYISSGEDREFERIKVDNAAEALEAYKNGFRSVDAALGDELEILFISIYTSFVNAF